MFLILLLQSLGLVYLFPSLQRMSLAKLHMHFPWTVLVHVVYNLLVMAFIIPMVTMLLLTNFPSYTDMLLNCVAVEPPPTYHNTLVHSYNALLHYTTHTTL